MRVQEKATERVQANTGQEAFGSTDFAELDFRGPQGRNAENLVGSFQSLHSTPHQRLVANYFDVTQSDDWLEVGIDIRTIKQLVESLVKHGIIGNGRHVGFGSEVPGRCLGPRSANYKPDLAKVGHVAVFQGFHGSYPSTVKQSAVGAADILQKELVDKCKDMGMITGDGGMRQTQIVAKTTTDGQSIGCDFCVLLFSTVGRSTHDRPRARISDGF